MVPLGTVAVTVLVSEPEAPAATVAVSAYVAVPPTSNEIESLMLPEPLGAHDDPDEAMQVHVALVSALGSESPTVAPVTLDGPLFVTSIVYVSGVPGTAATWPSVLVTARSTEGESGSVSVEELLAALGSETPEGVEIEAVFASEPVSVAAMVPLTMNVTDDPTPRFTIWLIDPLPDAAQLAPADALHVHVAPSRPAGIVSVTVAPIALDGPPFVATIV